MEKQQKDRQEKRRKRLNFSAIGGFRSRQPSSASEEREGHVSTASENRCGRSSRRNTKDVEMKKKQVVHDETNSGSSQVQEDTVEEDEESFEDDLYESQRRSLYSLPGAFRVAQKITDNRQLREIILEDGSIESGLTVKTPPVIVPRASLVSERQAAEQTNRRLCPISCRSIKGQSCAVLLLRVWLLLG